jgi:hypothetical protein
MLPAGGSDAKRESRPAARERPLKPDTVLFTAIARHNDDSMGKFSYSG